MCGEIFIEMADDVAAAMERREDIDKAEHLHFEVLIAHRELHHALVKAGFAENAIPDVDQPDRKYARRASRFEPAKNSCAMITLAVRFSKETRNQ